MKNRTTAAIFAFFLGWIGVHRFYLGQTGLGFLYLLFCWTFIPIVVALIDFIAFLSMSDGAFNAKYNQDQLGQSGANVADELEKLYNLKEKGVITDAEYRNRKAKLI